MHNRRFSSRFWNYLRMRGEYTLMAGWYVNMGELPPHARRILRHQYLPDNGCGTTSACAENTTSVTWTRSNGWNYLRMRGEYLDTYHRIVAALELPPHARRIHNKTLNRELCNGTTSACAENTGTHPTHPHSRGNYLRMRGEYACEFSTSTLKMELPPHARRIHYR